MSLWDILLFCCLAFIIISCCGFGCRRKQRGAVLSAPVVVTSATHTAPSGYTVTQLPVGATTTTISTYQSQAYTAPQTQTPAYTTSYPRQGSPAQMQMPMPMPMASTQPPFAGAYPNIAPYPPMPAASMNPPPYDVAVREAGEGQQNNTAYAKQAPYNPNFQM